MNYENPHRVLHRVYMGFERYNDGYKVEFRIDGLKTVLPKKLYFLNPAKLYEIA